MLPELISTLMALGTTMNIVSSGHYTCYDLQDSCRFEIVDYGDSALVIETVCAPICSSRAYVYNKEGKPIRRIVPTVQGVFPYATLDDDHRTLHWSDHTPQMLDKEENNRTAQP